MKWTELFRKHIWLRLVCVGVAVAVVALSVVNVVRALQPPEVVEMPSASYEHRGSFDYTAQLGPSTLYGEGLYAAPGDSEDAVGSFEAEEEEGPIRLFFRNMVDEFWLEFPYSLETSEPLTNLQANAEIVVYAQDPGLWKTDVLRHYEDHQVAAFDMRADLDFDDIDDETSEIEEDVGIASSTDDYIVETTVTVDATTMQGEAVHDVFVHQMTFEMDSSTVEFHGEWAKRQTNVVSGVSLRHEGSYQYEAFLNSTRLYEEGVIRSYGIPTAETPAEEESYEPAGTTLGPGAPIYLQLLQDIRGSYSYVFTCQRRVSSLSLSLIHI